jgi:hypothetical protein
MQPKSKLTAAGHSAVISWSTMLASLLSIGNNAKQDRVVKSVTIHPLLHPAPLKECCVLRPRKSTMSSPLSPRSFNCLVNTGHRAYVQPKAAAAWAQATYSYKHHPSHHAHIPASRCTRTSRQMHHPQPAKAASLQHAPALCLPHSDTCRLV